MNRSEIKTLKENLATQVQIYKGEDTLYHWYSGAFGSHTGFTTKPEAEADFKQFLKTDLRAEANMKSRGKETSIKLAMKTPAPKARKDYPDEVLAIAYELFADCNVVKTCAINACRYALKQRIVTQQEIDAGMPKAVALDMNYYNKRRASAAIV